MKKTTDASRIGSLLTCAIAVVFIPVAAAGAGWQERPPAANPSAVDAAAKQAFAALPGEQGFVLAELTDKGPQPLFGQLENERFAIGSSFKLFILGTLAEQVNADRRQLANVMALKADFVGPPNSEMANWPLGSPVTLHTLALKMISISDNTATDHLLHLLGRKTVERQMATMGHRHPAWNLPLISTREMVMLRDKNRDLPGRKYQKLDVPQRREFLASELPGEVDYEKLDFDTATYELAEWYATPMDMARAMHWLKQHTASDLPAHPLRAVLAVEPKLPHDPNVWPYVGFKGGSEDQLLCGNWLLQHRSGRWYAFHVFCNSPQEELQREPTLQAIVQLFTALEQAIDRSN